MPQELGGLQVWGGRGGGELGGWECERARELGGAFRWRRTGEVKFTSHKMNT